MDVVGYTARIALPGRPEFVEELKHQPDNRVSVFGSCALVK
jgi:hypothetical protein